MLPVYFHMAAIFDDVVAKIEMTYDTVCSRPVPLSVEPINGYVHTLNKGTAIFITDDHTPYMITIEHVYIYKLKTGDRLSAHINFDTLHSNLIVYDVTDVQHVFYDGAPVVKSDRTFDLLGHAVHLGTSVLLPVRDNMDIADKVAQITATLPDDIMPILLSFDGREINFKVPTSFFTKPTFSSREKLMTCLTAFFTAKQHASDGKHVALIIDSLDKMFLTFNNCMQQAGLVNTNLFSSAAVTDYENILCSSSALQAGGSLTIIGLHQAGTSPQLLQIDDRLRQIMDTVLPLATDKPNQ